MLSKSFFVVDVKLGSLGWDLSKEEREANRARRKAATQAIRTIPEARRRYKTKAQATKALAVVIEKLAGRDDILPWLEVQEQAEIIELSGIFGSF